jgi:mRNA interferase RelE/StbE
MATIEWSQEAIRDLERLDRQVMRRILRKLDWFSENFVRVVPESLAGEFEGTYKLRVGDWRVIYTVEGEVVRIWSIGHRKEIYKAR